MELFFLSATFVRVTHKIFISYEGLKGYRLTGISQDLFFISNSNFPLIRRFFTDWWSANPLIRLIKLSSLSEVLFQPF